jgi:general secretion pathway protein A
MYLDFYGFSETPFSLSPNPRFIFYSKTHKEAFALLLYGIKGHFGFVELTGEVGTGKTTVLRTLLSQLDEEKYRTALIFNPKLTAIDLMAAINREFGIPCESANIADLLGELNAFLLMENCAGRTVVLIIDEAQNLSPELLEQVRLISNLETDTDKLIQIVLAGQPELGRQLERPELRQINQRIALRYHLQPLDREDSAAYIEPRLALVGGRDRDFFSRWALRWLYHYSRGTPRLINILCDRALLVAYTEDRRRITARTVALAFRDVMLKPALRFVPKLGSKAALAIAALLLVIVGSLYLNRGNSPVAPRPVVVSEAKNAPAVAPQPAAKEKSTPGSTPPKMSPQPIAKVPPAPVLMPSPAPTPVPRGPAPQLVAKAPPPSAARPTPVPVPAVPATVQKAEKRALPQAMPGTGDHPLVPDSRVAPDSETQTALQAFNALASRMGVAPVSRLSERKPLITQLRGEAAKRGLELDSFNGKMDELLRLDTPALLDLTGKGIEGTLLVALTGSRNGKVRVHPPLLGKSALSRGELAPLWSGKAYILWRNGEKIRLPLSQGATGNDVIRVQILLQAAGAASLEVNGVYDENTAQAVKEFQRSKKISATGKLGPLTLIRLYREVLGPSSPGSGAQPRGGGA